MGNIVSIHSFRGGTGKSNIVANVSASLAARGKRVAIIDTDIQSPGIHVLFDLDLKAVKYTFTDYLLGRCRIKDTALNVTKSLVSKGGEKILSAGGQIFLVPSSMKVDEITTILSEGYDIGLLCNGYRELIQELSLDYLTIDTHPGINEETLLSIGISQQFVVIMRPDRQDYQGTALTVKIAKQLDIPKMGLVINKVLPELDFKGITEQIERTYNVPVIGLLPLEHEMVRLGSQDIFYLRFPRHALSLEIERITSWVLSRSRIESHDD